MLLFFPHLLLSLISSIAFPRSLLFCQNLILFVYIIAIHLQLTANLFWFLHKLTKLNSFPFELTFFQVSWPRTIYLMHPKVQQMANFFRNLLFLLLTSFLIAYYSLHCIINSLELWYYLQFHLWSLKLSFFVYISVTSHKVFHDPL